MKPNSKESKIMQKYNIDIIKYLKIVYQKKRKNAHKDRKEKQKKILVPIFSQRIRLSYPFFLHEI